MLTSMLTEKNSFFIRNKDTNSTTSVTYCMEKWSTVENAGEQDIKHRAMISILVAVLQVYRNLKIIEKIHIFPSDFSTHTEYKSTFSLQYFVPLLLVLLIYGLIYKNVQENQYPRHLRQTKTNTLLGK